MTHVTCRLTAKNRDRLRSVIEYGLPFTIVGILPISKFYDFELLWSQTSKGASGAEYVVKILTPAELTAVCRLFAVAEVHTWNALLLGRIACIA